MNKFFVFGHIDPNLSHHSTTRRAPTSSSWRQGKMGGTLRQSDCNGGIFAGKSSLKADLEKTRNTLEYLSNIIPLVLVIVIPGYYKWSGKGFL